MNKTIQNVIQWNRERMELAMRSNAPEARRVAKKHAQNIADLEARHGNAA